MGERMPYGCIICGHQSDDKESAKQHVKEHTIAELLEGTSEYERPSLYKLLIENNIEEY